MAQLFRTRALTLSGVAGAAIVLMASSATVLNTADISRKGVNSVADLQQLAPSVAINTFNRSTFINIRGVGIAQSAPTSNPGDAIYIDGVLIPHEQIIRQSIYDNDS